MLEEILNDHYTWYSIALIILIAIFIWKGWRTLKENLDERIDNIKNYIQDAEILKHDAQTMLSQCRQKQRQAAQSAEKIMHVAQDEAQTLIENAKNHTKLLIEQKQKQLDNKMKQAELATLQDIREHIVGLSARVSKKILMDLQNGQNGQDYVTRMIKALPQQLKSIEKE